MPPAARNISHNPRPSSTTNLSVNGGGSVAFVTDRSYSGTGSAFATVNNGATMIWLVAATGDADLTGISTTGVTINAAFNLSGPLATNNITAWIRLTYTDATTTDGAAKVISADGTRFQRINLNSVVATAGKTINGIALRIFNNSGVNVSFYVGGFDLRVGQAIDSFVHGAAGTGYSWEGTADNSPSNRVATAVAPITGSGGGVYPSVKLFVVDRNNQILRDITDHFIDGDVTYDLDADTWKGTCRLVLDDPTLIEPLAVEFVRIVLHLDYPDGTSQEGSIGQFMVDIPSERYSSGQDQWSYQGKDILAMLAQSMARGPYPVAAGRSYQSVVDDVLYNQALLFRNQVALPPLTQIFGYDWSWEAGVSFLKIVSDVLSFAGYQPPWATPLGIITSAAATSDPTSIPPALVLATGNDSPVRWPFQVDPDVSRVGNRVRVVTAHTVTITPPPTVIGEPDAAASATATSATYNPSVEEQKKKKKKKKKSPPPPGAEPDPDPTDIPGVPYNVDDPLFSVKTITNPNHPLSVNRLKRWIDIPDINVPLVADQAAADAIAINAIAQASLLPMVARITTVVMLRGLNEVYELDLVDSDGDPIESGQGRYFCRGWQIQLGLPWEMVHTLKRVVDFVATPFFN